MATANKIANAAHNRVLRAVKAFKLDHPHGLTCIVCAGFYCEYHHYAGYRWWWKVVPLCRWCHRKVHSKAKKHFLVGDLPKRDKKFLADYAQALLEWRKDIRHRHAPQVQPQCLETSSDLQPEPQVSS
jgi:hypothetical protein